MRVQSSVHFSLSFVFIPFRRTVSAEYTDIQLVNQIVLASHTCIVLHTLCKQTCSQSRPICKHACIIIMLCMCTAHLSVFILSACDHVVLHISGHHNVVSVL